MRATLAVSGLYSLVESLRLQRFGRRDPTALVERLGTQERYAKCARTPEGPVTMVAWFATASGPTERSAESAIEVALYGPGAAWLVPRLSAVLGLDDRVAFDPTHPRLVPLKKAFRVTRLVHAIALPELQAMVVLQQRVRFSEAAAAWRDMCLAIGARAPGPIPLWLPPSAEHWLGLTQPQARALGIDAKRWDTLQHAARAAQRIMEHAGDRAALGAILDELTGHGPWTKGMLLGLGAADADAVVLGDVHLPHELSAFFTDTPIGDDARMLELLEPFRPHRFRVVRVMIGLGRRRL